MPIVVVHVPQPPIGIGAGTEAHDVDVTEWLRGLDRPLRRRRILEVAFHDEAIDIGTAAEIRDQSLSIGHSPHAEGETLDSLAHQSPTNGTPDTSVCPDYQGSLPRHAKIHIRLPLSPSHNDHR
jgi:hypothetical protein